MLALSLKQELSPQAWGYGPWPTCPDIADQDDVVGCKQVTSTQAISGKSGKHVYVWAVIFCIGECLSVFRRPTPPETRGCLSWPAASRTDFGLCSL